MVEQQIEEIKENNMFRQIIIETDGSNVHVRKRDVTDLELKEICRIILMQMGG